MRAPPADSSVPLALTQELTIVQRKIVTSTKRVVEYVLQGNGSTSDALVLRILHDRCAGPAGWVRSYESERSTRVINVNGAWCHSSQLNFVAAFAGCEPHGVMLYALELPG